MQIFLLSGLIEDNWVPISTSAFDLLQNIVFEVQEKRSASHTSTVRKGKSNLLQLIQIWKKNYYYPKDNRITKKGDMEYKKHQYLHKNWKN